eukprot:CAMPEP_0182437202 /NCGR_PEP_ID=MMETSP1167-20130531/84878_1 /TAXON_ID=2988 /ORGANISM="Mallomonas Sp, Strain CCMP3275" /LENGTH=1342 /DNA_ID=CAMNT_0024630025 /DNA_START=60 /DNA_END=4089 /DNA_ORIENTATION=-
MDPNINQPMSIDTGIDADNMNRPVPKPVRELKVEDALLYLDQVKMEFSDKPQIYNEFLEIMKNFKAQSINTPGVIDRVKNLFRGYNKLILGFNTFLPEGEGYKIELTAEEEAQSRPGQHTVEPSHNTSTTPKEAFKPPQQMQQQHAISYVTTIRNRFSDQPETYRSFLKILHTYQKEQKGIKDVLEQVSTLFADHPDLLMEFTYFLPDAVQDQAKERLARAARESEARRQKQIQHQQALTQAQSQTQSVPSVQSPPLAPAPMTVAKRARMEKEAARATFEKEKEKEKEREREKEREKERERGGEKEKEREKEREKEPVKVIKKEPLASHSQGTTGTGTAKRGGRKKQEAAVREREKEMEPTQALSLSSSVHSISSERKFFDQIKSTLTTTSRDSWHEIIKCLELFSVGAVGKKDLFNMVQDVLGSSNMEIWEDFKSMINSRTPLDASAQDLWYALPLSEIDFSQCRKCTPSYRALPKEFPLPHCSERETIDKEVLNDQWVSIPIGSEESYSFKHMRKNQFEEALFRCEDERFEIDMIIDSNMCAIRVLEPLAEEIKQIRSSEDSETAIAKFNLQMDKRNLSAIHLFAISRIYGEHGQEILELLKKNPAAAVTVVLKRLKQKDLEWRKSRQELNKHWKETQEKNFERSFDHRSFYFRQQDRKSYSPRMLVAEIKALMEPHPSSASAVSLTHTSTDDHTVNKEKEKEREREKASQMVTSNTVISGQESGVLSLSLLLSSPLYKNIIPSDMTPNMGLIYTNEDYDLLKDIYRIICHAAESVVISQSDRERVAAFWRDMLRVFFQMPVHYLYTTTASSTPSASLSFPIDTADPVPNNTRVVTVMGSGEVMGYRGNDAMYKIKFQWGTGYLHASSVLGSEQLSTAALQAIGVVRDANGVDTILNVPTSSPSPSLPLSPSESEKEREDAEREKEEKGGGVFFGTQICYVFLRLHHTLFMRLKLARQLARESLSYSATDEGITNNSNGVKEEREREKTRPGLATNKSLYNCYFSELMAAVDGSLETARYEESCRQILGHQSYPLHTMDKIIHQALKCLQAMANDELVNKLLGLYMYHRRRIIKLLPVNSTDNTILATSVYRDHVTSLLKHTLEEVYRIQIKPVTVNDDKREREKERERETAGGNENIEKKTDSLSLSLSPSVSTCKVVLIQLLGVLSSGGERERERAPQSALLPDAEDEGEGEGEGEENTVLSQTSTNLDREGEGTGTGSGEGRDTLRGTSSSQGSVHSDTMDTEGEVEGDRFTDIDPDNERVENTSSHETGTITGDESGDEGEGEGEGEGENEGSSEMFSQMLAAAGELAQLQEKKKKEREEEKREREREEKKKREEG